MTKRGPKTAAGRAALRLNALRHGIISNSPVIPGVESEEDWERHRQGIIDSLQPEGFLEEELAARLAGILWRLHRVTRYEVSATMLHMADSAEGLPVAEDYAAGAMGNWELIEPEKREAYARRESRILPAPDHLQIICRYEALFHRQWLQTLHELEALQARRRGEPTHLAGFDISSPPGRPEPPNVAPPPGKKHK